MRPAGLSALTMPLSVLEASVTVSAAERVSLTSFCGPPRGELVDLIAPSWEGPHDAQAVPLLMGCHCGMPHSSPEPGQHYISVLGPS